MRRALSEFEARVRVRRVCGACVLHLHKAKVANSSEAHRRESTHVRSCPVKSRICTNTLAEKADVVAEVAAVAEYVAACELPSRRVSQVAPLPFRLYGDVCSRKPPVQGVLCQESCLHSLVPPFSRHFSLKPVTVDGKKQQPAVQALISCSSGGFARACCGLRLCRGLDRP